MRLLRLPFICLLAATLACSSEPADPENDAMTADADTSENVLLAEWEGPFEGVPPFDRMRLEDLEPAIDAGIAEREAELEAIASSSEAPTFENTIVAMEGAGRTLDRVERVYGIWSANLSSPEFREIQSRIAPKRAAALTRMIQNRPLFERIVTVRDGDEMETLRGDQKRLVELVYDRFARNGATLEGAEAERFAEIQERLAELHTAFGSNVLADEEGYVVYLEEDQLDGLSESIVKSAAAAAEARGQAGKYAVLNTRSSADPFLTYSDERELREQVWRNFVNRGNNGDEHDNNAILAEILQLRDERVGLLGYENYAEWRLEDRMAKTPERAMELLEAVWPAAVARVGEEVEAMQEIADAEGADLEIRPWDYRYYMEKVRQKTYDLDSEEVKQYLQLDKLREAMFLVAKEVFGFSFVPVPEGEVPVFHPDVKVWEVRDAADDRLVGLWYLDPFAREGKRSGAWATTYRSHDTLDGESTIILASNNSNFIEGAPGEPVLISWDDAETYFHEFGHALHYLSSQAAYPFLNNGVRDYTEFQSQLLERWLSTDRVIDEYLVHHETGEPIPEELVDRIEATSTFNQGFATTEYLASALVDLAFHTSDPEGIDPQEFERETLERLGMPDQLVMRHRSTHFGHVFSGEGYSAGYYGYLWAEVLTSDAAEAFEEAPGGYYDATWSKKLVDHLFSPMNSVEPGEAYRAFRGRDPEVDALLRDRGFPES